MGQYHMYKMACLLYEIYFIDDEIDLMIENLHVLS